MGSGKVSTPRFGRSKQLLLHKFFDPSTPSMIKGRDRGNGEKKRLMKIVATMSFASSRPLEHRTLVPIFEPFPSQPAEMELWLGKA